MMVMVMVMVMDDAFYPLFLADRFELALGALADSGGSLR